MIRVAQTKDVPQMKALWQTCFGDKPGYIDFFFRRRFYPEMALVYEAGKRIISMLFLLECSFQEKAGYYLYAAATHPDFRRQGRMEQLLDAAKKRTIQTGKHFIALVPARPSLFDYYHKAGFISAFAQKKVVLDSLPELSEEPLVKVEDLPLESFLSLRSQWFPEKNSLSWNKAALSYAFDENHQSNGFALRVCGSGYLLGAGEESGCLIYEFGGKAEWLLPVLQWINSRLHFTRFEVHLPVWNTWTVPSADYGMLWTDEEFSCANAYLGLSLQ